MRAKFSSIAIKDMNTSVVSVGIDVGKGKLDVACMQQDRTMVHQVFSNNVKGIRSLRSFLKQQRTAPTVPCTLESTGAYHLLVSLSLTEAGYRVNCVNPIITKKYMKATVRDAKSDKIDAKRIAELGYHEPDLQRFTVTREDIAAKSILSALAQLETLRQRLSAHIEHTKEMRQTLGVVIDCKAATKSLEQIEKQIGAHRARLCELSPKEAHVLASNVKGLSLEQASVLLIALSDKTFVDRDQLVAFVGLDVRVRQSGKWQGRQVLSKRGNGYLRKVLFQVAWGLKMHNPVYETYYKNIRSRGKGYKTSMIAVARKFLRFLFAFYWKKTVSFSREQEPGAIFILPALASGELSSLSTS
jgi:transposase